MGDFFYILPLCCAQREPLSPLRILLQQLQASKYILPSYDVTKCARPTSFSLVLRRGDVTKSKKCFENYHKKCINIVLGCRRFKLVSRNRKKRIIKLKPSCTERKKKGRKTLRGGTNIRDLK